MWHRGARDRSPSCISILRDQAGADRSCKPPRCRMPNVRVCPGAACPMCRTASSNVRDCSRHRSRVPNSRLRVAPASPRHGLDLFSQNLPWMYINANYKKKGIFSIFFRTIAALIHNQKLDYSRCVYPIPTRPPHILFLFFYFIFFVFSRWPAVRPVPPAIVLSKLRSRRSHGPRLPLDRIASSPRALRRRRSLLPSPVRNPPRAHGRRPDLCW